MSTSLNFNQLKIQARELLRLVAAGDVTALTRVLPYFSPSNQFKLANAQLVIARENGFESWPKLKHALEGAQTRSPRERLFKAIDGNDEAEALTLLGESPELAGSWQRTEYGWASPLHAAARHGRLAICRALIEAGAEIYAVNQGDYPPVFDAIYYKHREVSELLLSASAHRDNGQPPTYGCGIDIILAGRLGMLDRVQMHVDRDPFAIYRRGCIGESVLHWPAHNGFTEIVAYLLDRGTPIEADEIGLYGGKPLHWAAEHAPACVRLLLERGANPNSRNFHSGDFEGFTPLHMMARQPNECIECAELLLAAGADPTLTDAKGHTAADVARIEGRTRALAILQMR